MVVEASLSNASLSADLGHTGGVIPTTRKARRRGVKEAKARFLCPLL
jgi:hypothetical protein